MIMSSPFHRRTNSSQSIHYQPEQPTHLMNQPASLQRAIALPAFLLGTFGFAWILSISFAIASDQVPGAKQKNPVLIKNATVHTVTQGTLPNTSILVKDGKIAEIGANIQSPENTEVIHRPTRIPGLDRFLLCHWAGRNRFDPRIDRQYGNGKRQLQRTSRCCRQP